MIIPIGKSEKLYKCAFSVWITDRVGTRARYEFISTIDEEAKVRCFLYIRYRNTIFNRFFRRGRIGKSRFIANTMGEESNFLYQFNTVRQAIWREYGERVIFEFLEAKELGTMQISPGFLGKVKLYFARAWRAVVDFLAGKWST